MSFLNRSVPPKRRSNSPVASQCETELSDLHRVEEDKVYVNNNEGMDRIRPLSLIESLMVVKNNRMAVTKRM